MSNMYIPNKYRYIISSKPVSIVAMILQTTDHNDFSNTINMRQNILCYNNIIRTNLLYNLLKLSNVLFRKHFARKLLDNSKWCEICNKRLCTYSYALKTIR